MVVGPGCTTTVVTGTAATVMDESDFVWGEFDDEEGDEAEGWLQVPLQNEERER